MVIQTISKQYQVIRRLFGNRQVKGYVCREKDRASEMRYLLVGLMDQELSKKMIPYFMKLNTGEDKGDFINCSISEENLWLVFRYYRDSLFCDKVKGDLRLKERREISRSMVERILIQNLPYYLQYEALHPKNIVVSDALEVHFNYFLREPELLDSCGLPQVQGRLAESMEALFAPELDREASLELSSFIAALQAGVYSGYSEIYRDFRKLYGVMDSLEDEEQPENKNILLRMWDYFKKLYNDLKKVLYVAVLLVLVGMIIYTIVMPETASDEKVQFNQIGTLNIQQENGDEDEAGRF